MNNRSHIICRVAPYLIATLLLGPLERDALARGRSFPIEATGTILEIDQQKTTLTIQVDEPAQMLRIAVGRDCKFIQGGIPTDEQILKKGAYVRVSYFSTIFTGKIAVKIESNPTPSRR
jgi:hypothetical protein